MRRLVKWSAAWTFLAMLAWMTSPTTWATSLDSDPPAETSSPTIETTSADEPQALMEQGLDHERQHNWAAAIETYRKAVERWPSRTEYSRRLRLCELHFKLIRRYQDVSFRGVLLRLPREQAIDLYAEVLDRIQTHYVDPVPLEPLVRHGLDNLEVALRDPLFLNTNAAAADSGTRHLAARAASEHEEPARGCRPNRGDRDCPVRLRACPPGPRAAADPRAARVHLRRLRCP